MGVGLICVASVLEIVAARGCSLAVGSVVGSDCACTYALRTLAAMSDVELSSMGGLSKPAAGGVVEVSIIDGSCQSAEGADDNKFSIFRLSVLTAGAEGKGSDIFKLCVQSTGVGGGLSRLGLDVLLTNAFGELRCTSRRSCALAAAVDGVLSYLEHQYLELRVMFKQLTSCASGEGARLKDSTDGVLMTQASDGSVEIESSTGGMLIDELSG